MVQVSRDNKILFRAIKYISKSRRVKSLIDYGTGTGILGISFKKGYLLQRLFILIMIETLLKLQNKISEKNNLPFTGNIFLNPEIKKYLKKNVTI